MKRIRISQILAGHEALLGQEIVVKGWVRAFRSNRFVQLNDGSCMANLQAVIDFEQWDEALLKRITTAAALSLSGKLIASQGAGQVVELQVTGIEILGDTKIKDKSQRRQVYSSVGQPRIMRRYYTLFQDFGMRCGQVLATKRDFDPGKYRENMINCYEGLLSEGVIPIANEDDTVSLTTSMFSDNDELASLIAELLDADRLIILSDTDGLFTGHPDDEDSVKINVVTTDQKVEHYVQSSDKKEGEGRGGMDSILKVAKGTARKNIPTYIANGKKHNVIVDIIDHKQIGTKFIL